MTNFLAIVINPYDRKARVYPFLYAMLPIPISVILLFQGLDVIWQTTASVLLYFGITFFITQLGRDYGKRKESNLYKLWGGKPSVAMLRHSDLQIAELTKIRYRNFLSRVVPDLILISKEKEASCPKWADQVYDSATDWLLANTRDRTRFDLLFRENVNYGFRRNIWALKLLAFGSDFAAIAASMLYFVDHWAGEFIPTFQFIEPQFWVTIAMVTAHGLCFLVIVRNKWVKVAAEAYARQLLAACDSLDCGQ